MDAERLPSSRYVVIFPQLPVLTVCFTIIDGWSDGFQPSEHPGGERDEPARDAVLAECGGKIYRRCLKTTEAERSGRSGTRPAMSKRTSSFSEIIGEVVYANMLSSQHEHHERLRLHCRCSCGNTITPTVWSVPSCSANCGPNPKLERCRAALRKVRTGVRSSLFMLQRRRKSGHLCTGRRFPQRLERYSARALQELNRAEQQKLPSRSAP